MDRRIALAAAAVAALGSSLVISSPASAGDEYEHYRPYHRPHYEYRHHHPRYYQSEPDYRYERPHHPHYTKERPEPRYYPAPKYRPEYRGPTTVVEKPAPVVVRPPTVTVTEPPSTAPLVEAPTTEK